jgi:hypothetical protein
MLGTNHVVAVHSVNGVALYEFGPRDMSELVWSRELRNVSSVALTLPPLLTPSGHPPDIVPWLHWVTVWDTDTGTALWSGPIQKVSATHSQTRIQAKDCAAFMARTRTPLTKKWENVDPSVPAAEMWRSLIALHRLKTPLIVRADPQGSRYDYSLTAGSNMMDSPISDLTGLGLRWTVVAGVVILGPAPRETVAELGENDFVGESLELTRDGSRMFNDVLLRAPDSETRAHVDMFGLNLQTIIQVDSMFGVSNADHAVAQYVRYFSKVRDAVGQPGGAVLHPDAPLAWDQMIPSARFSVSTFGLRTKTELESVTVTLNASHAEVAVRLESVTDIPDLPELAVLATGGTKAGASQPGVDR